MKVHPDDVESAALALAPEARLRLAHALVRSLESADLEAIGELWLDEAERRNAEMDEGTVAGLPGQDVLDRVRSRYR